jgi:hypothetical protein
MYNTSHIQYKLCLLISFFLSLLFDVLFAETSAAAAVEYGGFL